MTEYKAAGRDVRVRLFGKVSDARSSDAIAPFVGDISDEANWGQIWARPGLPLETRSMCVIAVLAAQDQWEHCESHVRGARNLGVSRDELVELAAQLIFYATLPRAHRLLKIIARVYE